MAGLPPGFAAEAVQPRRGDRAERPRARPRRWRQARGASCGSQQRHPAAGPLAPMPGPAAASRMRRASTCRHGRGAADRLGQTDGVEERHQARQKPETRRGARRTVIRPTTGLARVGGCSGSWRAGVCGCCQRLTWDLAIDGGPGSSGSRRDRLCRLPPSARTHPSGPRRPCKQCRQQRRRPRRCNCSAGARAARSSAGTWQHRDVDADHRAPSQRCLASRDDAQAPHTAWRSHGRRRGGRGGRRSRGASPMKKFDLPSTL